MNNGVVEETVRWSRTLTEILCWIPRDNTIRWQHGCALLAMKCCKNIQDVLAAAMDEKEVRTDDKE